VIPIVIIGAGPAGIFAAIHAADTTRVVVLEKTKKPLAKVRISGGGRCNVTHACFDPKRLIQNYPRGSKELLGPFNRFGPKETLEWFQEKGVALKTEQDGRIFPTTDSSQTIIDCLLNAAKNAGVELQTEMAVEGIEQLADKTFCIHFENRPKIYAEKLLIATGSSKATYSWLKSLGHTIQPLVPSLFTLNIEAFTLKELAGISVQDATITLAGTQFSQTGPLLITHWGFSGPCALKLSSFAARYLHDAGYKTPLEVCWIKNQSHASVMQRLQQTKNTHPKRHVETHCPFTIPLNLWKHLAFRANASVQWAQLSNQGMKRLCDLLCKDRFEICGQTTYKEEFVTCGGISLDEVSFKTMESKLIQNCFFAGEVLDIDGITGGFNFQNAWTTGFIAGSSMASTTGFCGFSNS